MVSTPRFVFISYAREDGTDFAAKLSRDLSEAGHHTWRDTEQLSTRGGDAWEAELTEQLLSAELVVVVLTPAACSSLFVRGEFSKALDNKLTVVPALFLDCDVPLALTGRQHLDFQRDPARALTNLLAQLDRLSAPGAEISRNQETLKRLLANRERAANRGSSTGALDLRISAVRRRIDSFSSDLNAQASRVERGLAEEKKRAPAELSRDAGSGVLRVGDWPQNAIGDTFYDRVDQQASIAAALIDPRTRVVSVLGRGGMGKSALACCVLADFEQRKRPGPGGPAVQGIAYLDHTPTEPITLNRMLSDISRVLPEEAAKAATKLIGDRGGLSTENWVDCFLELMPQGLVFALLDNFEDLLDERGRIRDADLNLFVRRVLMAQGTLRLLITARAAINLPADELRAERQMTLSDGLPEVEAIALLRGLDPNRTFGLAAASDAALRELVQKTYGIPYALKQVPNILKGDESVGLLDGLSELANDFWARETIVENLVEVNYRKLRLEARRVAETLAVFAIPVPRVAVDFLLQPHMPGLRLEEVLQPLVNARLVYLERGGDGQPTTLGLHRIDRDFLYYRLPTEGSYCRSVLHSRAAAYYRTQRTVGPRGWRDIKELQPQIFEYEHLVMAVEYDAAAMLLGEYAGAIARCGHPRHCRDLFLKLPDQFTSESARVMYGVVALVWKSYLGPVFEGLEMGEQALQLALAMKDEQLELLVRGELAIAYRYGSDSVHSREHAEKIAERTAASAAPASGAAPLEDVPGFNLVLAYTYQGDVRRAAPLAHQDYELARSSRKPLFVATALNGMAVLYFAWGRYADAVRFGTEAEAVWMPGFHDGIVYVKNILGMSHYLLGDYPAAIAKLADAITTADEWDSPRPEALAHWNLSLVNLLHGVYDAAARHGREAEVLMTRLNLDRAASAPRLAAEAALNHDTSAVVRALLAAAREWTMCGDLFPGPRLAEHAGRLAHAHQLDALAADADALTAELNARIILPLEPPALGA